VGANPFTDGERERCASLVFTRFADEAPARESVLALLARAALRGAGAGIVMQLISGVLVRHEMVVVGSICFAILVTLYSFVADAIASVHPLGQSLFVLVLVPVAVIAIAMQALHTCAVRWGAPSFNGLQLAGRFLSALASELGKETYLATSVTSVALGIGCALATLTYVRARRWPLFQQVTIVVLVYGTVAGAVGLAPFGCVSWYVDHVCARFTSSRALLFTLAAMPFVMAPGSAHRERHPREPIT
jgi:hypothetical protein